MDQSSLNVSLFFWMMLIAFVVAIVARRAKVPYPLALVVTGLLIGVPRLLPQAHLDPQLLLTAFLPPLLFEAAINLRIEPLKRDWAPIALYTFAGTILSTFVIGGLTAWGLGLPFSAALVFGALISTTDPISVIAVFGRLGANRRLRLILEAESLFNNDTAVVLFTVMMAAAARGHASSAGAIVQFIRLVAGGAAVGGIIGCVASRVHYELDDHLVEITLTTVVAFGSYLGAESLGTSGVMAVVVAGLVIGNYGMTSAMSPGTRLAVAAFWEYASFVVNPIVFLLIGIEVCYVHWSDKIGLTIGAIFAVLAGRAVVYPLSWLINRAGWCVPRAWQHVLFWGGLRGALSMALVLGIGRQFPDRDALVAATFGVVLASLLVQGTTIGPLLRRLGLASAHAEASDEQRRLASEIAACDAALAEIDRLRATEAYPSWSIELLARRYAERRDRLFETIERHDPDHRLLSNRQAARVRRAALMAEKSALWQAERDGDLDVADWDALAARIDAELADIRSQTEEIP